jgi:hypothetical protein
MAESVILDAEFEEVTTVSVPDRALRSLDPNFAATLIKHITPTEPAFDRYAPPRPRRGLVVNLQA